MHDGAVAEETEQGWTAAAVIRLALANGVGFSGSMSVPFWIGGVSDRFGLPIWSGATLASGQLACLAAANILTPWLFRAPSQKSVGMIGATLILSGNLLALVPAAATFIIGCLIAGCGLGILLNVTNRFVVQLEGLGRTYSLFQIVEVIYTMMFMLFVPMLIAASSIVAIPAVCACLGLLALFAFRSLPETAMPADRWKAPVERMGIRAAGLCAMALFFIGQSSINAFIVVFGARLSMGVDIMGRVMAAGLVLGLVSGAVTRWMGDRFGTVGPIAFGAAMLSTSLVTLSAAQSQPVFIGATMMMFVWSVFVTPFAFTILAQIDRTGRTVSIGPAFLMIGIAIGPVVGGTVVTVATIGAVGWVAGALIMASALLFFFVRRRIGPIETNPRPVVE